MRYIFLFFLQGPTMETFCFSENKHKLFSTETWCLASFSETVTSLWTTYFFPWWHILASMQRTKTVLLLVQQMTSHLVKGTLHLNIMLSFPFSSSLYLRFCSKSTLPVKSTPDGRLPLQQIYFETRSSDRNSESYHQSNRIMSHREKELHNPHFISARLHS